MKIYATDFAIKAHFEGGGGTQISLSPSEFCEILNAKIQAGESVIEDSPYPFCKYILISNFTDSKAGTLKITEDNSKYIRCAWKARREGELPFLSKQLLVPYDFELPIATHLAVIVYSREQIQKEEASFKTGEQPKGDYGIVAIQANMFQGVEPMTPATIIRNAMGKEYGGNGDAVDNKYLIEAEKFWAVHASVMFQKKYPEYISRYQGATEDLAEEIGNLRYDALVFFLDLLAEKLYIDGKSHWSSMQTKLAIALRNANQSILKAKKSIEEAWKITRPNMEDDSKSN